MVIWRVSETGQNPDLKQGRITAFLRWWGAELRTLVPPRLAVLSGLAREVIVLVPEGNDFTVRRCVGGAAQMLGLLSQAGKGDQVARYRATGAECVLRIPSAQGLRRQAPIAVSALPRGYDAVAGEIERQTPFAPDQVYLGYHVEDTIDPRGRVMAHLALVPCASTDMVLQTLSRSGIVPDRITLADDANENSAGDTVHILRPLRKEPAPKILLAAVSILLLVSLVSPFWRNSVALSDVEKALALARQAALPDDPGNGAGDAQSQMTYLVELRGQRPPVTALLNAISTALPDTAHLAQFELSGRTLALQGVAHAAPDLIAPLEALDQVAKVEFTAPTLRDPVQGLEQFQLTIQLRAASVAEQTE